MQLFVAGNKRNAAMLLRAVENWRNASKSMCSALCRLMANELPDPSYIFPYTCRPNSSAKSKHWTRSQWNASTKFSSQKLHPIATPYKSLPNLVFWNLVKGMQRWRTRRPLSKQNWWEIFKKTTCWQNSAAAIRPLLPKDSTTWLWNIAKANLKLCPATLPWKFWEPANWTMTISFFAKNSPKQKKLQVVSHAGKSLSKHTPFAYFIQKTFPHVKLLFSPAWLAKTMKILFGCCTGEQKKREKSRVSKM